MKKTLIALLIAALLLTLFCCTCLGEAVEAEEGATAPLVNLTGVVIAVVLAAFDFLLAWIARVLIPPLRAWLNAHVTEKQKSLLWDAVVKLVDAAEQTIRGPGQGEKRLAYVEAGLLQRGFTIDNDLIEAAVRQMKQNTRSTFADAFGINTDAPRRG